MGTPIARSIAAALFASSLLARPSSARAEGNNTMHWTERLVLRAEGSAGAMFSSVQREQLAYDRVNGGFAVRAAFYPLRVFALQLSHANDFFPAGRDLAVGRLLTLEGGLRVEAPFTTTVALVLDGNAGLGFTGAVRRVVFDFGLGVQIRPVGSFAFGPVLRYTHVVQDPRSGAPQDAQCGWGGVEVSLRLPTPASATATPRAERGDPRTPEARDNSDRDDDGVLDSLDECPDEPAGAQRDRRRLGCPEADADLDTVPDAQDLCPNVARGAAPHPNRPGCPDHDQDGDGLADHRDACMDRAQGFYANPRAPGCPLPDRDNDAIPDALDACPEQRGAPSRERSRHGCAGLLHIDPLTQRVLFDAPVLFVTDHEELDAGAEPVLEALVELLNAMPSIARLAFELPARQPDDGASIARDELARRRGLHLGRWLRAHGVTPTRYTGRLPAPGATEPLLLGAQVTVVRPEPVELVDEPTPAPARARPARPGPQRIPSRVH